ncbi:MAG: hypothetical protein K2M76_02425 [Muribaculaceae bacterium]|nr:hypothetical protein [Muribaculaceae bacterium]
MKTYIIVIITLITSLTAYAQGSDQYFSLMGQADKAIADSNYVKADSLLTEALRLEPANPSNYLIISNLGMVRHYAGRDSMAIASLNMAHDMAPKSVTVLTNRARVLTDIGRLDEALRDYDTALALDSTLIEPRFYRALINLSLGHTSTAEIDVRKLEHEHPSDRFTHLAGAALYSRTARPAEAIACYTRLIHLDDQPEYRAMRAELYLRDGQLQEASDDIAMAMQAVPDDPALYLMRALLNKARFRPDDAQADGRRAIELGADPQVVKALLK